MALTRGFIRNAVTTPLDARLMDMARVVSNADGSPRPGVLGVLNGPLLTASGSTMSVAVAAAPFVTTKGKADGVAIFTNDGTVNVAIAAAPVANSRVDVIWVKHNDDTTGDATSTPAFGVTAGAAAASPTKPAIPTGALELGTLRVYATTTTANGAPNTLMQTYQMTAMQGGIVPFRTKAELDLWTNPLAGQVARTLDDGRLYERVGASWLSVLRGQIRPGAVSGAGASIAADGAVVFTAVPASTVVQIRDIFTAKFSHYRLVGMISAKPAAGYSVRGIVGTTPIATALYTRSVSGYQFGARADAAASAATDFGEPLWIGNGSGGGFELSVLNPNVATSTVLLGQAASYGGTTTGVQNYGGALIATDKLTGLQIAMPPGGTTTGEIRIYGVE